MFLFASDASYSVFPAKQTALVPFRIKHLLSLLIDLTPISERIGFLEELNQILVQILQVLIVLTATLLDVEWH